jgi:hypothetical protein
MVALHNVLQHYFFVNNNEKVTLNNHKTLSKVNVYIYIYVYIIELLSSDAH